MIWISYTPSAQARHIGDNKGIRRERAIDIDVDPADSTDVDVITSAATALSLDDTVEMNRTEDLAEAIGRITLGPDPAPTPRLKLASFKPFKPQAPQGPPFVKPRGPL